MKIVIIILILIMVFHIRCDGTTIRIITVINMSGVTLAKLATYHPNHAILLINIDIYIYIYIYNIYKIQISDQVYTIQ